LVQPVLLKKTRDRENDATDHQHNNENTRPDTRLKDVTNKLTPGKRKRAQKRGGHKS
jgi:hypothetical protein